MPKFRTEMSYLGIFEQQFGNNIVMFEISTLEFVSQKKLFKKTKSPIFGTKNALFGYLWRIILKNYFHI